MHKAALSSRGFDTFIVPYYNGQRLNKTIEEVQEEIKNGTFER